MAKKTAPLLPRAADLLIEFGERLRLVRLRRRLSAKQVAERAGMAPMTLRSLERGGAGVTMGAYLAVMQVLGIEDDLALLAKEDGVGRTLQDARLATRPKIKMESIERRSTASGKKPAKRAGKTSAVSPKQVSVRAPKHKDAGAAESGFVSARDLVELLKPSAPGKR